MQINTLKNIAFTLLLTSSLAYSANAQEELLLLEMPEDEQTATYRIEEKLEILSPNELDILFTQNPENLQVKTNINVPNTQPADNANAARNPSITEIPLQNQQTIPSATLEKLPDNTFAADSVITTPKQPVTFDAPSTIMTPKTSEAVEKVPTAAEKAYSEIFENNQSETPDASGSNPKNSINSDENAVEIIEELTVINPYNSIMLRPDEAKAIDSAIFLYKTPSPTLNTAPNLVTIAKKKNDYLLVRLDSLLYFSPNQWSAWINGVKFTPSKINALEYLTVKSVNAKQVSLTLELQAPETDEGAEQSLIDITLSPNQSFLVEDGTILEGSAATQKLRDVYTKRQNSEKESITTANNGNISNNLLPANSIEINNNPTTGTVSGFQSELGAQ